MLFLRGTLIVVFFLALFKKKPLFLLLHGNGSALDLFMFMQRYSYIPSGETTARYERYTSVLTYLRWLEYGHGNESDVWIRRLHEIGLLPFSRTTVSRSCKREDERKKNNLRSYIDTRSKVIYIRKQRKTARLDSCAMNCQVGLPWNQNPNMAKKVISHNFIVK